MTGAERTGEGKKIRSKKASGQIIKGLSGYCKDQFTECGMGPLKVEGRGGVTWPDMVKIQILMKSIILAGTLKIEWEGKCEVRKTIQEATAIIQMRIRDKSNLEQGRSSGEQRESFIYTFYVF